MVTKTFDIPEGPSHIRPLLFNGVNYPMWKQRFEEFLSAIDFEIWFVVRVGTNLKLTNIDEINDTKDYLQLLEEDNHVCTCATAKKMWDMLEITHERTKQLVEERFALLIHYYECSK
ncbi:hypothetical protein CDL12_14255 [Handroanthus impetiginosus]|uniref:Retrotransposon Copia-like N-terminal domain-containing protein n=1 Tax=Handroanthus impetiginosus TaxID=429701 RepID=A0A2G9H6H8_9LAMI|nr:hypothetical protein CDL12_14255 [Handroanthus impetiginosus]